MGNFVKHKKNTAIFILTSFSTIGLGIVLMIPILNNYILNEVIRQETGIDTKYYYRPYGKNLYGKK